MPKMDGITVLQNIRAKGNDVPILILTAKSEVDDRVLGLDSGADDYLSKPFAAKELLARIRSVTRRRTEAVPFGNAGRVRKGYVIGLSDKPKIAPEKIKEISEIL